VLKMLLSSLDPFSRPSFSRTVSVGAQTLRFGSHSFQVEAHWWHSDLYYK